MTLKIETLSLYAILITLIVALFGLRTYQRPIERRRTERTQTGPVKNPAFTQSDPNTTIERDEPPSSTRRVRSSSMPSREELDQRIRDAAKKGFESYARQ